MSLFGWKSSSSSGRAGGRDHQTWEPSRQQGAEDEARRPSADRYTDGRRRDDGYAMPASESGGQELGQGSHPHSPSTHPSQSSREHALEKENKQLRAELHQREKELKNSRKELQMANEQWSVTYQGLRERDAAHKQQMDALTSQLQFEQQKFAELKELLDQRNNELRMVEPYISRGNALSGKELRDMVEALNQEILQTSMTIFDSLDHSARQQASYTAGSHTLLEQYLPSLLLGRLAQHGPLSEEMDEELGLQVALQSLMAGVSRYYAQSWCPSDDETATRLQSIYHGLYTSDPHTAPRWRAMTRAQLRQQFNAQNVEICLRTLIDQIRLLLQVCGWTEAYLGQNTNMQSQIDSGLRLIVDWAMRLNKAMGEDMIQDEPQIIWSHPGSAFDPQQLEDAFEDPRQRPEDAGANVPHGSHVLCTTELGLRLETPQIDGSQVNTILKAKALLSHTLGVSGGKSSTKGKRH